jgi:long-subunit acyl-CoA synthetase (AMP-forming)
MVEKRDEENKAPEATDGVKRSVIYGHWRTDQEAKTGYSHELVPETLDKKYYDNINEVPLSNASCDTILKHFERQVKDQSNANFLGTRAKNADGTFGAYEW